MRLAPLLHAQNVFIAPEIVASQIALPPMALTADLAGVPTSWSWTVMLVMLVPGIRMEELPATAAFASARYATHRAPRRDNSIAEIKPEEAPRRRSTAKKEEELAT
jgi:hypothetical protein